MNNLIKDHAARITLSKEIFKYGGGRLAAVLGEEVLPCGVFTEKCETPAATYLWKPADTKFCPLAFSKIVKGRLTTAEDDTQVFMSTDGSLVCLVLKYEEAQRTAAPWSGPPIMTTSF